MRYLLFLYSLVFLFACSENKVAEKKDLSQFKWLLGEWMDSTSDGKMIEIWNQIDDSVLVGSSIYMAGTDTIFYEEISMRILNDTIFYIPSIQSQNDGEAVYFALTSADRGEFTFENKMQDFPQKIIYTNPQKDSLVAFIEGPTEKGVHREVFKMRRSSGVK